MPGNQQTVAPATKARWLRVDRRTYILVSEALHVHQALVLEVIDGARLVKISLLEERPEVIVLEVADGLRHTFASKNTKYENRQ
jgi:hypothetical protein